MNFYTVIEKETESAIGDIIEFDDNVCVIKYNNSKFPDIFTSLDRLIENLYYFLLL